jgi:hypothetical protein
VGCRPEEEPAASEVAWLRAPRHPGARRRAHPRAASSRGPPEPPRAVRPCESLGALGGRREQWRGISRPEGGGRVGQRPRSPHPHIVRLEGPASQPAPPGARRLDAADPAARTWRGRGRLRRLACAGRARQGRCRGVGQPWCLGDGGISAQARPARCMPQTAATRAGAPRAAHLRRPPRPRGPGSGRGAPAPSWSSGPERLTAVWGLEEGTSGEREGRGGGGRRSGRAPSGLRPLPGGSEHSLGPPGRADRAWLGPWLAGFASRRVSANYRTGCKRDGSFSDHRVLWSRHSTRPQQGARSSPILWPPSRRLRSTRQARWSYRATRPPSPSVPSWASQNLVADPCQSGAQRPGACARGRGPAFHLLLLNTCVFSSPFLWSDASLLVCWSGAQRQSGAPPCVPLQAGSPQVKGSSASASKQAGSAALHTQLARARATATFLGEHLRGAHGRPI